MCTSPISLIKPMPVNIIDNLETLSIKFYLCENTIFAFKQFVGALLRTC